MDSEGVFIYITQTKNVKKDTPQPLVFSLYKWGGARQKQRGDVTSQVLLLMRPLIGLKSETLYIESWEGIRGKLKNFGHLPAFFLMDNGGVFIQPFIV